MQNVFGIKKIMQLLCSSLTVKYYKIVSDKCCDVHTCRFYPEIKKQGEFFFQRNSFTKHRKKLALLVDLKSFIVQFGQLLSQIGTFNVCLI